MTNVILLDSVPSTNTWAKEHSAELHHGNIVLTHNQTLGRGQRGNHWEAEPGKNLTFSLCLMPDGIHPAEQFVISEIVSIAVVNALQNHLCHHVSADRITVKWPNDIYVDNRKIAGILIEHTLRGCTISQTIAGIGLNVNQTDFLSPAPNPVSMSQLSGKEYQLNTILQDIVNDILHQLANADHQQIHLTYLNRLWRKDGKPHRFSTPNGNQFEAVITNVSPTGMLTLTLADGATHQYAFKEVSFEL